MFPLYHDNGKLHFHEMGTSMSLFYDNVLVLCKKDLHSAISKTQLFVGVVCRCTLTQYPKPSQPILALNP